MGHSFWTLSWPEDLVSLKGRGTGFGRTYYRTLDSGYPGAPRAPSRHGAFALKRRACRMCHRTRSATDSTFPISVARHQRESNYCFGGYGTPIRELESATARLTCERPAWPGCKEPKAKIETRNTKFEKRPRSFEIKPKRAGGTIPQGRDWCWRRGSPVLSGAEGNPHGHG